MRSCLRVAALRLRVAVLATNDGGGARLRCHLLGSAVVGGARGCCKVRQQAPAAAAAAGAAPAPVPASLPGCAAASARCSIRATMQFSEPRAAPAPSARAAPGLTSHVARGQTQRFYAETFRVRELEAQEAAEFSLATGADDPDEHHRTTVSMPSIQEDEATRAMQLTGLQPNDPFLASANARFQARLENHSLSSGGGARRAEQQDAREALGAALRCVVEAKRQHKQAVTGVDLFYLKTGGEVLSADEIARERLTAERLRVTAEQALAEVRRQEQGLAAMKEQVEHKGHSTDAVETLLCTPATAHVAPSGLSLDVTLPEDDAGFDPTASGGTFVGEDLFRGPANGRRSSKGRHVLPPTRQRRRTKDPEMPRSDENKKLRQSVRIHSVPEGSLSPVMRRTATRHALSSLGASSASAAQEMLAKTRVADVDDAMAEGGVGRSERQEWGGRQTVAGQLLELSRENYRNQRRGSFANDGKLRSLSAEPAYLDPTLSRSGNFGAYMSLEKSATGAWRGQDVASSGGYGNLAIGAKLEANLDQAWKSLAARRVASSKANGTYRCFLLCIYMPVIDRSLSDCRYSGGSEETMGKPVSGVPDGEVDCNGSGERRAG